jgi:hypothetical protein
MTLALVMAAIVLLGAGLGVAHNAQAAKPQKMTFPVTPQEGDTYATAKGSWKFDGTRWQ